MNQDQQSPAASHSAGANHAFYLGDWLVEPELNRIQRNGEKVHLEPKAMEVLLCLSRMNGSVISKEQLIRQVWPDTFVTDDVLKGSIWQLRKAFQDDSKHPSVIETIPKGGYRLLLPVRAVSPEDSPANVPIGNESRAHSKRWVWIVGIAVAVLAGASGVLFLTTRKHREASLEIVPFTTLPGFEGAPSFSPDGNQIVFSYDDGKDLNIFVKAIGDEKILQLTESPGLSRCPQWSPDGRFIAYLYGEPTAPGNTHYWVPRTEPQRLAIYLMSPLGGAKRKLIDVTQDDCLISWSVDSKSVFYADKPSPDEPSGVFIVDIVGAKPHRLTTAPSLTDDWDPSASRDGKQVAFIRQTDYATRDLYVVPISGGEPTRLTFRNAFLEHPIWTSDGKGILFSDAGGGFGYHSDLYWVPVSGGTPERLPFSNHDARYPAISPRGNQLVYMKGVFDTNIWKVSLSNSTEPPAKFIASTQMDSGPAFSPDGRRIVFTSDRDGTLANWICNADGSNPTRLSELQQGGTPRWSPDGRQIAFDSRAKGRSHIYVVPAEDGLPWQLTEDDFDGQVPSWSADGNWIYFSSSRSGSWEIWKVSLRSKEAVQVTRHGGFRAEESPDGKFVYYDKPTTPISSWTGADPGIWVMPASGGPEKLLFLADHYIYWHVRPEGIYYIQPAKPHHRVQLYRFASAKVTTIAHLDKQNLIGPPGLCISPDGRTLLYSQVDTNTNDLMLVKNGKW
jgi:Tol biopolymer transport system component/DNA-binding winged helix-turn-helix (wHTH) protein